MDVNNIWALDEICLQIYHCALQISMGIGKISYVYPNFISVFPLLNLKRSYEFSIELFLLEDFGKQKNHSVVALQGRLILTHILLVLLAAYDMWCLRPVLKM